MTPSSRMSESSSSGLRQRKGGTPSTSNVSTTSNRTPAVQPVSISPDSALNDPKDDSDVDAQARYGYDGSEDDEADLDDEDDDEDEVPLPLAGTYVPPSDDDDFIFLLAAGVGFVLFAAAASFLPPFGIQSDYVIAGGMVSLLAYIVVINLCPSRFFRTVASGVDGKQEAMAAVEGITPQMVFISAGCLGVMLGGVIGSALQHMHVFG